MSSSSTFQKQILLDEASITLIDGIVYVRYNKDVTIDIELQAKSLEAFNEITDSKLTPFLFEADEGVSVTKEARDNAVIQEERTPCKATAVVVQNIAYAMVANFYLKFNKPKRPYKVFNNKQEAVDWLKLFL